MCHTYLKRRQAKLTITNRIKAPLLTRNDDVRYLTRVLKPLRSLLDPPIAVQHGQQPIGRVQALVLLPQILVNVVVRRAERVNVGLVDRWPGQADGGPGAGGDDFEVGFGEDVVAFH